MSHPGMGASPAKSGGHAGQFSWSHSSGEMSMGGRDGANIPIGSHKQQQDDVEVMSTDSSSSSSTDSNS